MKTPRDLAGTELAKLLSVLGYTVTRQTGSHIRVSTTENGGHHVTIPSHNPMKTGTLTAILNDIAKHFNLNRDELLRRLFQS